MNFYLVCFALFFKKNLANLIKAKFQKTCFTMYTGKPPNTKKLGENWYYRFQKDFFYLYSYALQSQKL